MRVDTQASASTSATASAVPALSRDKPTGQEGPAEWFTGKVASKGRKAAPRPKHLTFVAAQLGVVERREVC